MKERSATFIASLDPGHASYLEELYNFAKENDIPVISREGQGILKLFLKMQKPIRILEVGTAIGFSALLMKEYAPPACSITTIEKVGQRITMAEENFRKYDTNKQITLIKGDANDVLKVLDESYDFIFMDAAKGQYLNFLPYILRLLNHGGILISDNVLQDGDILESRYIIKQRDRTIHSRMRDYLYELKHRDDLCTEILDVGDGVAVSYAK